MSEQTNNPPKEKKEPTKKANPNRISVVLGDSTPEKPMTTSPRKKTTATSGNILVDMPGKLKHSDENKPSKTPSKQTPKPKEPKPKEPKPKTPRKPTPLNKKAPPKKRTVAREKIVPPKIGTRRSYGTSLGFRLRAPVFLVAFLVCVIALVLTFCKEVGPVGRYVAQALASPTVELIIEPGMSAKAVSLLLKERGVVDDDQALLHYFISNNITTSLRSGMFVMEKGMAYEGIGHLLTAKSGELVVEISPSFTLAAVDRYLANRGYAKKGEFLEAAEMLANEYSLSFAEGWLLSGEYVIASEESATELAEAMFAAMLETVQPHLSSEQVSTWGLEQTLIVASMIQAETQNIEEMPLIASVIYNRLEAGQPLGIDATTRYEIDDWKNPIPKKALETKTPYNTRRKVGLPPSGICSPSKEAIEAALFPLESTFFYYLHGLDKRLHPAITYEEHKQNIKTYR